MADILLLGYVLIGVPLGLILANLVAIRRYDKRIKGK